MRINVDEQYKSYGKDMLENIYYLINWGLSADMIGNEENEWKSFLDEIADKIEHFGLEDDKSISECLKNGYDMFMKEKKSRIANHLKNRCGL